MNKEQFTPGPYAIEKRPGHQVTHTITADGRRIGEAYSPENANLFAASFDMYEALKDIRDTANVLFDKAKNKIEEDFWRNIYDKANSALNKANPSI